MMDKLVLRQVVPEYQGDWLLDDLRDMEGFMIYGNRDFIGIDVLNTYGLTDGGEMTGLETLVEDFENVMDYNEENPEEEFLEVIEYYIRTELTEEKMLAIRDIITESMESELDMDYEEMLIKIIEIIDGRKLERITICGYCQGDWQEMLYDPEKVDPREVETYYFNKGREWEIGHVEHEDDEEINFETVDLDFGTQYTLEWSDEEIRKQFAEWYDIDEKDVVMLGYDGYKIVPKYKVL